MRDAETQRDKQPGWRPSDGAVTWSGASGVLPTARAWLCRRAWAPSAVGRAPWVQTFVLSPRAPAGAVVQGDPKVASWAEQE